ncbi:uncharacterized protein LOC110759359 [Prunus avium]|uniref:Uncharacterized protein LOC110759359 n=1 Tax=Prunus avium TaxID=42229 RepID=A0A6P5SLY4_PRUAV|nr:uncharacterized protein LOC110759359 [Prunus avium]
MAANEFMGDLDIPTIPTSPSSILLPTVARNYELKSSHLNMLPSFYGLPNEDLLTHIKDIFNVVSSFPLTGVTEDQLRMRVFPYTLKDKAKYWLNSLKPSSLTTWAAIQKKCLEKYFSIQKTDMLRDKILLFAQQDDESFCEAWERFNGLLNQCPHHGIPLKLQMQQKLDALLALNSRNPPKEVCSICETQDHATIACPLGATYPEFVQEQANVVNSYNQGPRNDPYSQSYNPENEDEEEETIAMEGEQLKTSQFAPNAKSDSQEPNKFQLHKRGDKFVPPHLQEDRYVPPAPYVPPIPFPGRLQKAKQDKAFKEIYDILSKVNINLPLLDVIEQIPAYGKFIKNLKTHKLNFAPNEEVKLNKNVSAVLQRKLPPKLDDPGSFDIPINIGGKKVGRAMLDLGASINVLPYSVYQELGLEGMKKTSMRLELADHSIKYPKGIVEDILVQFNTLILPADFVVMDMEDNPNGDRVDPILLGRPFMATTDTIIKVKDDTLSMTVLGETVEFKVFDALSQPSISLDTCFSIDVVNHEVSSKILQKKSNDALEAVLTQEEEDLSEPEFQEVLATLGVFQPYPPSFRPPLEPPLSSYQS